MARGLLLGLLGLLTVSACEGKHRGPGKPAQYADADLPTDATDGKADRPAQYADADLPTDATGGKADSVVPPHPDAPPDLGPPLPDAAPTSPDLPLDAIADFDLLPEHAGTSLDLASPPPDALTPLPDAAADVAVGFKNLEIAKTGDGTVTSSPPGVNCGSTCSAEFPTGTVVVLTPAASARSVFKGWTGQCFGTATCTLTISGNSWASATFTTQYTFVCDPVSPQDPRGPLLACPAGFGCDSADSLPLASNCVQQSAIGAMYSPCLTLSDCAIGYQCSSIEKICRKYCFSVDDCPANPSANTWWTCIPFSEPRYAGTMTVGSCMLAGRGH